MSSLFLNGLYTYGINAISSANNLILGGTNTNNIQILSPIIGDGNNPLIFRSSPDQNTKITLDSSSITLDATNILLNVPICPNYLYSYNGSYTTNGSNGEIFPIGFVTGQPGYTGGRNATLSPTGRQISNPLVLTKGVWYIDFLATFLLSTGSSWDFLFTYVATAPGGWQSNSNLLVETYGGSQVSNGISFYHKGSGMVCLTEKKTYYMYQETFVRSGTIQTWDEPYYFRATRIA